MRTSLRVNLAQDTIMFLDNNNFRIKQYSYFQKIITKLLKSINLPGAMSTSYGNIALGSYLPESIACCFCCELSQRKSMYFHLYMRCRLPQPIDAIDRTNTTYRRFLIFALYWIIYTIIYNVTEFVLIETRIRENAWMRLMLDNTYNIVAT